VNLRKDDLKAPLRPSSALEETGGVGKVHSEHLGARYEVGPKMRRENRVDLRAPEHSVYANEDISYPPVRKADPTEKTRVIPAPPEPTPDPNARSEGAQLGDRMGELMRRASKDS
jgi:hypothetical protein